MIKYNDSDIVRLFYRQYSPVDAVDIHIEFQSDISDVTINCVELVCLIYIGGKYFFYVSSPSMAIYYEWNNIKEFRFFKKDIE